MCIYFSVWKDILVQWKNMPGTIFHSRWKRFLASRDRPILSTYKNVIYLLFLHKIQLQKNEKRFANTIYKSKPLKHQIIPDS